MIAIDELKKPFQEINKAKLPYLFLFIQFVYFSGLVKQFGTDEFLVANILFTGLLCVTHKKITNNDYKIMLAALGVFVLINIVPSISYGFSPRLVLGYSGRIFLGILIVLYFKHDFFKVFENLVFALALISLPLFLIQLVHAQFFDLFSGFSHLVLTNSRLHFGRGELTGHRYLLIFLVNSWGEFRNSGFMWEPAAFGAMLSWAMVINGFTHRFTVNARLIILVLASLTTFSIGTYLYLLIFSVIFLSRNYTSKSVLSFVLILAILTPICYRLDFVEKNFEMISWKMEVVQIRADQISRGHSPEEVSRVGGFLGNIKEIIFEPFGFGARYSIAEEQGLYISPNGFMTLARNWGMFSLLLIFICFYKFVKKLRKIYEVNVDLAQTVLLMILVVLPIAGNPFYNQPLLFSILLCGFIVSPKPHPMFLTKKCFFKCRRMLVYEQ